MATAGYLFPETAGTLAADFRARIDAADVEAVLAADPAEALQALDPGLYPQLDEQARAKLRERAIAEIAPTDAMPLVAPAAPANFASVPEADGGRLSHLWLAGRIAVLAPLERRVRARNTLRVEITRRGTCCSRARARLQRRRIYDSADQHSRNRLGRQWTYRRRYRLQR
jgi:hypothetical protein